jgi:nucleoid-associated protein EbfC
MAKGRRGSFPGGMGGPGGGNMNQMMQQAQRLQREMARAQEEIAAMTVEAEAGGGVVRVQINGERQVTSLTIDPEILQPEDVELLQDLLMVAFNEAQRRFDSLSEERMNKVTGGQSLPGF